MEDKRQPLISAEEEENQNQNQHQLQSLPRSATENSSSGYSFSPDANDIYPINGVSDFFREFCRESKMLWYLAGPSILNSLCVYSIGGVTTILAGHVNSLLLAAISIQSVIAGFTMGFMFGMGSALETLCGQAVGAKQFDMLGIYIQRSWVIISTTALIVSPLYIFCGKLLKVIGQTAAIAEEAGLLGIYCIPQLFAVAIFYPLAKFFQSQSKVMVIAFVVAMALVLHAIFSWLFMLKLGWGLVGAAVMIDFSWWFINACLLLYIISGHCGQAWSGFSMKAFQNLWSFVKLSLASAVMLCLEIWYFMILILFAGYLKNAEISVDAMSICITIVGWMVRVALGMQTAVSVRVSNELGAGHPSTARFSVVVAAISSLILGFIVALALLAAKTSYPSLFSSDLEVQQLATELTPLLALCIIINNIQPVLSGVAVGAGWQASVAFVNIVCYYVVGIPIGALLAYVLDMGIKGIWTGMLSGTFGQTCILLWMIYRTNWSEEASVAEDRIKKWGGHT